MEIYDEIYFSEKTVSPKSLTKENKPEVRASGEDKAMEVVNWSHGVYDDIGEWAIIESLQLDVVTQWG